MSIFNTPKYDPQGSGSQVGATNLNKMATGIDAATLRPGVGTMIQYTPAGMVVSAKKTRGRTVAVEKLIIVNSSEAGKYKITDGTVNSETPTLSGAAINATTPPEITVTADTYVWLKIVGTFGSPDTYVVTVETSSTSTTPAGTAISATAFTSFFYIGWVNFTAGSPDTFAITNAYGGGNLGVESFGNVNLWWKR